VYDQAAAGIASTHTTPPYPLLARRLGEEGSLRLQLTISPQGIVTEAQVVRSSGYDDLDRAARDWVKAHWRYRPALRGGRGGGEHGRRPGPVRPQERAVKAIAGSAARQAALRGAGRPCQPRVPGAIGHAPSEGA